MYILIISDIYNIENNKMYIYFYRQHDEVPTTTQPDRKKEKKDEDVPSMKME